MDIRKLAEEGRTEEIEQQLMDLDSEFRFKCRKCGKCCKHQDTILFNPGDIFNIARKLHYDAGGGYQGVCRNLHRQRIQDPSCPHGTSR